jgi:hypothetical protein
MKHIAGTAGAVARRCGDYLVVAVVVSVVFVVVEPSLFGTAGSVVVLVSSVVVAPVVLPSLVCEVFVSVLYSVVPFWLPQPMVTRPNTTARTDARKYFISIPSFNLVGS